MFGFLRRIASPEVLNGAEVILDSEERERGRGGGRSRMARGLPRA